MKFLGFNILSYKKIIFGDFTANQFILFEHKRLFTLLFFYFKGSGWQDRFHTHAFNAISVKIFGTYMEAVIEDYAHVVGEYPRTEVFKYFPRDSYHKLGHSKGCLTMLLAGPWRDTWKEMDNNWNETELNWGRK